MAVSPGCAFLCISIPAVGRDILPQILRELGAEVVTAGRSETFVSIDTENITDEQLDRLEEFAVAAEASGRPLHAIVSTDGDSDRPLVTAVLPASEVHPGGRRVRFCPVTYSASWSPNTCARMLPRSQLAPMMRSSDAWASAGLPSRRPRSDRPYVISALDELRRAGKHTRIVGWEANGGFLTGSDIPLTAGTLIALPTRDSTLPILANLFAAAEQRIGLPTLWNRLPARFGRAGLLDNVPVAVSQAILAHLIPPGDVIEVEFDGTGRVFDRSRPGAAPRLLAEPATLDWQQRRATLMRFFTPALGFDDIVRINVLDGVRLYFRNGDVAHIRPSGNAPQLRIYANSDSQARADQIVELALREPDGILRQLERAFTQGPVTASR